MQWQTLIEMNSTRREYEIHLVAEMDDGSTAAAAPIDLIPLKSGERSIRPFFTLPGSRALLQSMMDALWAMGVRTSGAQAHKEGRHAARMGRKLANLRHFAFEGIRAKAKIVPGVHVPVITPDNRARFEGRTIQLTPTQALLLTKVASEPGRQWTRQELGDAIYGSAGSKQPLSVDTIIRARLSEMRSRFREAGLDVGIQGKPGRGGGFTFSGVKPLDQHEDIAA